jgi:hypothetical protein
MVHDLFIVFVAEANVIESLIPPLLRAGESIQMYSTGRKFLVFWSAYKSYP